MKNFTFNIICIILISLFGTFPYWPWIINGYGVASLGREMIIVTISIMAVVNTDYKNIASKCVLIGFAVCQIVQLFFMCLYYFFYIDYSLLAMTAFFICTFTASVFMARQITARYKFSSDEIDNGYIYYLSPKADDFNGLISSLVYLPFSGVKVYCNGKVYAYRKGQLRKFTGTKASFYVNRCLAFNTNVIYSKDIESELEEMIGTKWTIRNNCYRTFSSMFGSLNSLLKKA